MKGLEIFLLTPGWDCSPLRGLNGVYSEWLNVPVGAPQGTRLGPWLFLVLINDLRVPDGSFAMWKFADDTTVLEIVPQSKQSALQQAVDFTSTWSQDNRL